MGSSTAGESTRPAFATNLSDKAQPFKDPYVFAERFLLPLRNPDKTRDKKVNHQNLKGTEAHKKSDASGRDTHAGFIMGIPPGNRDVLDDIEFGQFPKYTHSPMQFTHMIDVERRTGGMLNSMLHGFEDGLQRAGAALGLVKGGLRRAHAFANFTPAGAVVDNAESRIYKPPILRPTPVLVHDEAHPLFHAAKERHLTQIESGNVPLTIQDPTWGHGVALKSGRVDYPLAGIGGFVQGAVSNKDKLYATRTPFTSFVERRHRM